MRRFLTYGNAPTRVFVTLLALDLTLTLLLLVAAPGYLAWRAEHPFISVTVLFATGLVYLVWRTDRR